MDEPPMDFQSCNRKDIFDDITRAMKQMLDTEIRNQPHYMVAHPSIAKLLRKMPVSGATAWMPEEYNRKSAQKVNISFKTMTMPICRRVYPELKAGMLLCQSMKGPERWTLGAKKLSRLLKREKYNKF